MMLKRISLVAILLASVSCANEPRKQISPETNESLDKAASAIKKFNNRVVSPIFYMAYSACAYKHDSGKWPNISRPSSMNNVFELYKIISKTPNYEAIYKPKGVKQFWRIKLSYSSDNEAPGCRGETSIGKDIETNTITLPFNKSITDVKKSLSLPYAQYEQENMASSLILSFVLFAKEHKQETEIQVEKPTNNSLLLEAVVLGSICALLDKNPGMCPLQLSPHRTSNKKNNDKIKDKVRQMLKQRIDQLDNEKN